MGCLSTKPEITNGMKYNKNHRKRKMFSLGIGIERGDITMSAHTQIGYVSAMVKKYDKQNMMKVPRKLMWMCLISCLLIPITVEVLLVIVTLKLLFQF
jgi:hypothetical protein